MSSTVIEQFALLASHLDSGLVEPGARSFDLLHDGLAVTVRLHPSDVEVAVDVWCHDLSGVEGEPRRLAVRTLLMLNTVAAPGLPCVFALDARDLVLVHGSVSLNLLSPEALVSWLEWLLHQAVDVRDLLETVTLSDVPRMWPVQDASTSQEH